eukprot:363374-Chlamydomonas_euryale.AAC.10
MPSCTRACMSVCACARMVAQVHARQCACLGSGRQSSATRMCSRGLVHTHGAAWHSTALLDEMPFGKSTDAPRRMMSVGERAVPPRSV